MEFVMTYGWAIIVVTIGLALLYTILKPGLLPTSKCEMGVGLQCLSFKLNKGDAGLVLVLTQALNPRIRLEQMGCTKQDVNLFLENLPSPVMMDEGVATYVSGGNSTNNLRCRDMMGNQFVPTEGYDVYYLGKLCIRYTEMDTGLSRTACGSLSAPIE